MTDPAEWEPPHDETCDPYTCPVCAAIARIQSERFRREVARRELDTLRVTWLAILERIGGSPSYTVTGGRGRIDHVTYTSPQPILRIFNTVRVA